MVSHLDRIFLYGLYVASVEHFLFENIVFSHGQASKFCQEVASIPLVFVNVYPMR